MLIVNIHKFKALPPTAREQLNILILFPGYSKDKQSDIYDDVHTKNKILKNDFFNIYDFATQEKHNFLYIDIDNGEFRKNFDEEIQI